MQNHGKEGRFGVKREEEAGRGAGSLDQENTRRVGATGPDQPGAAQEGKVSVQSRVCVCVWRGVVIRIHMGEAGASA